RNPAEQAEAKEPDRDRRSDLAAQQEKAGKDQRRSATERPQHARRFFGIDLGKRIAGPQQQKKNDNAEEDFRHVYLSCSSSETAPPPCASNAASAVIPPAA